MSSEEISQKIKLAANPQAVYEAIMDSRLHEEFTGLKAEVSRRIGEAFKAGEGWIEGVNLDLEPGKRIVQAWRNKEWPKGSWSVVTVDLEKLPGGKTLLTLTQSGVPEKFLTHTRDGWSKYYWEPMNSWLDDMGESGREALSKGRATLYRVSGGRLGKPATKKSASKKKSKAKKSASKKSAKKTVLKTAAKPAAKKATKKVAAKKTAPSTKAKPAAAKKSASKPAAKKSAAKKSVR